jgi:hypothetical protein
MRVVAVLAQSLAVICRDHGNAVVQVYFFVIVPSKKRSSVRPSNSRYPYHVKLSPDSRKYVRYPSCLSRSYSMKLYEETCMQSRNARIHCMSLVHFALFPQAEKWLAMCRSAWASSKSEPTMDFTAQNIGWSSRLPQDDAQNTRQSVPDEFSGRTTPRRGHDRHTTVDGPLC